MKILIELPTWLGDTVMATPAIENILNYYNDSKVTLIGPLSSIELFKNHPKIEKSKTIEREYISLYKNAKNLGKFDVFFSFRESFRSKLFNLLVLSKKKYQFEKNKYPGNHQVKKYYQFINDCLGIDGVVGKLILYTKGLKVKKSKLICGINPGASYGDSKRWYPDEFAKVAIELSSSYEIIIFGGPNEKDIALDIEKILIKKGVVNYQNLAGNTTVTELMEHIAKLDLFVTGDSGPMHVAAGLQVPTVSIFGPTNDDETSQWGNDKSIILKKNLECQPCMKRSCPLVHHDCMKMIKSDDVLEAVNTLNINISNY